MTKLSDNFIFDYIRSNTITINEAEGSNDSNFLYDYNEVQELYGEGSENDVYIVGATNLCKTDMLQLMAKNLLAGGMDERNIIYLDFVIPFIRNIGIQKAVSRFSKVMTKNKPFYVVINEVSLCGDWVEEIKTAKEKYPFIRFLCSSSISSTIHEHFHDNPDYKSKIIVLSEKNESNTKCEQERFGVFDDFKYNIKHGVCEIKGLTEKGKQKSLHVVPEAIEKYPVKIIASGAFHHRVELTEIVLPDSIEFIGDYAFTYCKNLKNIKLPTKLSYIGDCTFLGATALSTISGGENITHIGNSAFYGTNWLTENKNDFVFLGKTLYRYNGKQDEVSIPTDIETIGYYAFAKSAVKKINLDGVCKIEEGAFCNCKQLLEIKNYDIDAVSSFQFCNCTALRELSFTITNIGKFAFLGCMFLERIEMSATVISDCAFEGCVSLVEFLTKTNLQAVGNCAFYNTPLNEIDLSKTEMIGVFAFYNSNLNKVNLDTVNEIDDYAFADSTMLTEVSVSPSANIGKSIFLKCFKIRSATLGGQYRLNSYFGEEAPIKKLCVIGSCTDNFCRGNSKLLEVDIQGKSIGNWAFYACTALQTVKLTAKTLGAWCFAYCDGIKEIEFPSSTEYISMNAFRYCHNLAKITISTNKPLIFGANAFYSTAENKRIYVRNKSAYLSIPIWKEYVDNMN